MERLTDAEKQARGTRRPCRDVQPRSVKQIKRDIRDAKSALRDMRHACKEAGRSIRTDGIWLITTVIGAGGVPCESKKANPAFTIQQKALSTIKTLKHSLVLLNEELELASAKQNTDDEFSEFSN